MKKLLLLLILSFFSVQSFAASCPDGSEPVKSLSADGTYFVFECDNTADKDEDNLIEEAGAINDEGSLIKYNFNKGAGAPFCDDPRGYCASWKSNASSECKDNYRFGNDQRSLQTQLDYENCVNQVKFKPFIGTKLKRSSNASPTRNEKANADRLIKAGWDKSTLVQPKIIAASDVPKVIKDAVREGLNASIDRLGSYGPLKIYIIGNDDSIIEPIIKDFCNWSKDKSDDFKRCSDDQGEGMREMAYIFPGGNGFADHGWYLQKPTQTFVLNPTAGDSNEFLALKYDDELQYEKVVTAHEYFHVYQAAHTIFRGEENSVYSLPRWMEESNASYFSWVTGSENGWIDINDRIVEIVQEVSNFRDRVPGMTIIDIESESGTKRVKDYCAELCIGSLQYSYALIATILLAQKTSDDALFVDFYKNHKDLGWMDAFKKTFKISVDEFYLQLEDFLNNPVKFQIEQLTISSDFKEQPEVEVKDSKLVSQSNSLATKNNNITIVNKSSFPTVDYNTNLLELCKRDVEGAWKNDIKNAPYMFAVAGEDGRCEYGLGDTENSAFEDCTKFQEENNIVGTCELYGEAGKVVWDGSVWEDSVKVSKSASKEVSTIETNESVDYVERLKQVKALLDDGIINEQDFEKMKQKIIDTMN